MLVRKVTKLLLITILSSFFTVNSFSIEPKDFVQQTVDSAAKALDQSLSKELKIIELKAIAKKTVDIRTKFNAINSDSSDIFSPVMLALRDGNQMGSMVDISDAMLAIMGGIFLIIVMVVLWNMGLMNGLRRYGEVGLRLAIGEPKGHVYRSLIIEASIIGFVGTVIGTVIGLLLTYYVQENGIDYTKGIEALSNSSMIMPNIFYAQVTPDLFYIGFFPGVLATVLGTMLAGMAVYKREMAQLFKDLES